MSSLGYPCVAQPAMKEDIFDLRRGAGGPFGEARLPLRAITSEGGGHVRSAARCL
jgi:hypothetical protein